ncbi:hypothetical protein [Thermoproteus tenax]|uniref:Uncharacterized protein n=1 Tax=Thermoproteus tenax (strain ATCC 35583 / DSM 2078 / JCM 9277 / NBRC 100435 / Kra 1) TaxID=768679 RepID=G4RPG3_THETK|nr:hypothetical protein [Thermoproteus tenax]CCC81458.1 hypothetical protein TTX_0804 [Thermoproteus tenax Kra 1]
MDEALSVVILAASMFLLGLIIGLATFVLASKAPQTSSSVAVYISYPGGSISISPSQSCPLVINTSGIYSCTGLLKSLNGTLNNATIIIG